MNILLIGFMGCGKTSLGEKLAEKMNFKFIDLDEIIVQSEQLSINEIFNVKGESYFRKLETDWLSNFEGENFVVSLGGGTPCFNDNMKIINSIGTSVYLQLNSESLTDRLVHSKQKRPLIESFKNDKAKLTLEIDKLLKRREVFYNKANIIFEVSNMSSSKLDYLIGLVV
jgi:shikimate kinase